MGKYSQYTSFYLLLYAKKKKSSVPLGPCRKIEKATLLSSDKKIYEPS